jgi:hypothetical protein
MSKQDLALRIVKRQQQIESIRTMFEQQWVEVDRYVAPSPNLFYSNRPTQGQKTTEFLYDSTASLALHKFAAAIESVVTPRTGTWHSLSTSNPELNDQQEVKIYLEETVRRLFAARYQPSSNFASQANEIYEALGKYGTGCMFVDDGYDKGIIYKAIHISELYVVENSECKIDTVYRKFQYTARQAIEAWGENNLPDVIVEKNKVNPDEIYEFIHAVEPNKDYITGDPNGMKFKSIYVSITDYHVIEQSGYRTLPYCVVRYNKNTGEVYGHSPAMDVLPDIKMVQTMSKVDLNAAQLTVQPPLLLPSKGILSVFNLVPGALNYGGLDDNGRPNVIPLNTGSQVNIGETMAQQRREVINDAFLISLFQILVDTPQMTATEAMLRAQEKGDLLAPSMGRIQSELLGPMIERELDILGRAGLFPQMPPALQDVNGEVDIIFTGPLNKAQRAPDAVAILRMIETAGTIAQFSPDAIKRINFSKCLVELADITGVPADVLYTDEEMAAIMQQQQQQQMSQQMLQAAPVAAQTAKTIAQAQQIAGQPAPGITAQ